MRQLAQRPYSPFCTNCHRPGPHCTPQHPCPQGHPNRHTVHLPVLEDDGGFLQIGPAHRAGRLARYVKVLEALEVVRVPALCREDGTTLAHVLVADGAFSKPRALARLW